MSRHRLLASLLAIALCGLPASADITNLTQGTTHATIQEAINASVHGDEIVVDPGEYLEHINLLGRQITLRSQDPEDAAIVASTIISGGGGGTVITCTGGETADTHISGFVVTGGASASHAALRIENSGPTVTYCVFEGHSAQEFTGTEYLTVVRSWTGSPTFRHCAFSNNVVEPAPPVDAWSIMLHVYYGSATVDHCCFGGNTSTGNLLARCYGIDVDSADVTISDCDLSSMFAATKDADSGGQALTTGLYVHSDFDSANVVVSRCRVALNAAVGGDSATGWGIWSMVPATELTISDSDIVGNSHQQIFGYPYTDGGGNTISDFLLPPSEPTDPCPEDINGDGVVNQQDLGALLAAYEQNCP
jgi:Right handed beta helix region